MAVQVLQYWWSWWWDGLTEDFNTRLVLTILVATSIIFWYLSLIKKLLTRNLPPLPPGPPGLPLVGNLPFIEPDLHRYFANLSKTYGPIFKLQLGSKTCIVVSSSSVAKQVLKDKDSIFANRDKNVAGLAITYGGQDIAWRPNDDGWRKLRRVVVREMMSNTSLDASYMLRRQEVREMVKQVHRKVGSPINISQLMFLTLLNLVLSMLWGEGLHGEDKSGLGIQLRQVVQEIVELVEQPNISDFFPVLARFDLQGIESKTKKLLSRFDTIFDSTISKRNRTADAEMKENSKDFLQFLLELNKQGNEKHSLSLTEIKALFMDMITAGTDTSSTTVEWAMAEMLQHPHVMRKIYEELDKVVGKDNIVEESHLPNLQYLLAVIKETLRIHPIIPLLMPHSPSKSCTVEGYTIPKGARVFINVWKIHRDPEVWKNPLNFDPERFMRTDATAKSDFQGNDFNYIPFGSGRRICPGIPLAEKMMVYALASLLHSFEWKLHEGTKPDLTDKFGVILKKMEPLICIPTARLPSV